MSTIIVGVDGSERSADAIRFAALLARRARGELVLANAYPYDDAAVRLDTKQRHRLRDAAQTTLDSLRRHVPSGIPVLTSTIADRSPARALHTLAVRDHASLIVIGSSHRGTVGRVFIGTTAERVLHGAPCPVAVVPRGEIATALDTIAVGWDARPESAAALNAAVAVALACGAQLRVVQALDAPWLSQPARATWPGLIADPHTHERSVRERLELLVAGLPDDVAAEPVILHDDPVDALAAQSEDADLLVLGSRGYGPHRAVLLGSVSGRALRASACPVIVVPRGVAAPLERLFRPTVVSRA
ncbi:MAG TPA: universal stress protein [Solirubrobacteraceae bacterium]|nr:universal stress protein [Solirubrobacteraceae bacterium]